MNYCAWCDAPTNGGSTKLCRKCYLLRSKAKRELGSKLQEIAGHGWKVREAMRQMFDVNTIDPVMAIDEGDGLKIGLVSCIRE